MNRAAVLIGVRQAGSLPRLEAVWDGVEQMEDWARDQGLPDDCVTVLTDQQSPVSATDILQAVKQYVERRTFDQLIVYFSGHGLNVGYTEYWLLSKFPDDGTTAVNVATSIEIARSSIIPHVVFISDACRTAADAVHTQAALNGALSIFPNVSGAGQFRFVDAFYATVLGRPALEVRAPNDPAGAFQGIYTEAMVDALRGRPPIIPEPHPPLGKAVIRPWPLKRHLDLEVPQRMLRVNPRRPPSQQPDAVISSDPASWISAIDETTATEPPAAPSPTGPSISELSHRAFRNAVAPQAAGISDALAGFTSAERDAFRPVESAAAMTATPFGPMHFETGCGFKVRGSQVVRAWSRQAHVELHGTQAESGAVHLKDGRRAATVLLSLATGQLVLLPALLDFVAGLTFENGELVDVNFEPSDLSGRWQAFQERQDHLRSLRGIIAASTHMGVFRLEEDRDVDSVARSMQLAKGIDPSMGIYAAYAYRRQGERQRLNEMCDYMRADLGVVLFDVAMLAGALAGDRADVSWPVAPPAPLLTQGWHLLDAFAVPRAEQLEKLRRHVHYSSLWTLFSADAADMLMTLLELSEG